MITYEVTMKSQIEARCGMLWDIIFKGNPLRMNQDKFGLNWPVVSEEKIFEKV
jgi:hypothetical protein